MCNCACTNVDVVYIAPQLITWRIVPAVHTDYTEEGGFPSIKLAVYTVQQHPVKGVSAVSYYE